MIQKIALLPQLGSFYIVENTIYFNTIDSGIDHPHLWKIIVTKEFKKIPYEIRKDLINAPYGAERGRVTWTGTEGKYILFGTNGCQPFEKQIAKAFNLQKLGKEKLKVDWVSDEHYVTKPQDVEILKEALRWEDKKENKSIHLVIDINYCITEKIKDLIKRGKF